MQGPLRRASTAAPLRSSVPEMPTSNTVSDGTDWAQAELSSYFKLHPEKLSVHLDRIMDKLRGSQGDMAGFIVELDGMIDELNADIDRERRGILGRDRLMRDFPDVTNEFLHFFLDGIMEAMEDEQAAAAAASNGGGGGAPTLPGPFRGGSPTLVRGGSGGWPRPRSSGSNGSSKERFANVAKRMAS